MKLQITIQSIKLQLKILENVKKNREGFKKIIEVSIEGWVCDSEGGQTIKKNFEQLVKQKICKIGVVQFRCIWMSLDVSK